MDSIAMLISLGNIIKSKKDVLTSFASRSDCNSLSCFKRLSNLRWTDSSTPKIYIIRNNSSASVFKHEIRCSDTPQYLKKLGLVLFLFLFWEGDFVVVVVFYFNLS